MVRVFLAAAIAATALQAAPAAALIAVWASTPDVLAENVTFRGPQTGRNSVGFTSISNIAVTFTGAESLAVSAGKQARIAGADGTLNQLDLALDPALGFTNFGFNIFGSAPAEVTLNVTDQSGSTRSRNFQIGMGDNYVSALSGGNELITRVSLMFSGEVSDVRQLRIGGFGRVSANVGPVDVAPEPASWAMMMIGFGLVGGTLRRRRWQVAA